MHVIALAGALQDVRRLGDEASGLHAQLHNRTPSFELMVVAVPVGVRAEIGLLSSAIGATKFAIN